MGKIITLTTDLGLRDPYVPATKGFILRHLPDVQMIDLSHTVKPFDIAQAAWMVRYAHREFPDDTVHLITVGGTVSRKFNHVMVRYHNQWMIGCDNGIFSLITEEEPELIIELCKGGEEPGPLTLKDVYAAAAVRLLSGTAPTELGPRAERIQQLLRPIHPPESDTLKGSVAYIDSYGNVITDISSEQFVRFGKNLPFSIELFGDEITTVSKNYFDVAEGEKLAFFNSAGYLEIAINKGSASALLNIKSSFVVRIRFQGL
jgi:hypothetical protein